MSNDRQQRAARAEQMRKDREKADRKQRNLITVGIVVVVVALIAAASFAIANTSNENAKATELTTPKNVTDDYGIVYTPDADGVADGSIVVSFIGTPDDASPLNPGTGKPFMFTAQRGIWTMRIDLNAPLYRNICVALAPVAGAVLPPVHPNDTAATGPGGALYIESSGGGECYSENNDSSETLFSRSSRTVQLT